MTSLIVYRFKEVTSTMDVARQLIREGGLSRSIPAGIVSIAHAVPSEIAANELLPIAKGVPFVVISEVQTKGRGTSGRSWSSSSGSNLSMSLALPYDSVPMAVLPVLPLLVGLAARACVARVANTNGCGAELIEGLQLKWPNDLLCGKKKVMGALIENEDTHLIIGVGMNIGSVPEVDTTDGSREATSLMAYFASESKCCWDSEPDILGVATCKEIIQRLHTATSISESAARQQVIDDFGKRMAWDVQMRKRCAAGEKGPEVIPLQLNSWGHLWVRNIATGAEETLSSEYLN